MRLLLLVLFTVFFDSNASFSLEDIKNWFAEMYNKGSSEISSGLDKLKSSSAGKKVGDFLDETKDALRDNRSGTISAEFEKARKDFADCAAKLNKELESDIRSLSQLEDVRYHDRVVIYKDGKNYVTELEECLAKELDSFSDARMMKKAADDHMSNIMNVLTDELIYSYVDDLRESHRAFNNAFEDLKEELKNKG